MIDKDNLSLMFFDDDHITTYKPLVCNEDVTAPNLYNKTEVNTLIANIPSSSSSGYTDAQIDALFSTQTEVDTIVATKQNLLNNGSGFSVDVGRGELYFENNLYDDNNDGGGVTIRSKDNPTGGSILAVRSSGHACRLWVGQSITTPGDNDFYAGYTGASGAENIPGNYSHQLTSTNVAFGTNVSVTGTISADVKNFVIQHPTKGGNWRLKHSCLESLGVPVFYKYHNQDFVKGENFINLPEWFNSLVFPNSAFVMTQSHKHFGSSYGDIVDNKIKVTTNKAGFYHVRLHAERDYDTGEDEFEIEIPSEIESESV